MRSLDVRATVHTTMGVSSGALIFQRDMLLNIPILANYEMIRRKRQARIAYNVDRENAKRTRKDYVAGDEVLILSENPRKLDPRAVGPFVIQQVHTNGTVTILRNENVYERINVRRIKPYNR